jgi:type IV pilus assembly protein PilC
MPTFTYSAINANSGREESGEIQGINLLLVTQDLKAKGLFPTTLVLKKATSKKGQKKGPQPEKNKGRSIGSRSLRIPGIPLVSAKELTIFTRQLATLVHAEMPLLRSLEVLARQQPVPEFRTIIEQMAETIRTGGSLSDGVAQNPKIFNPLYLNMIKAGEASGALDVVLQRLAEFQEKSQKIKGKVQAAMTYPLIIMVVALGVVGALVVFVIPRFQSIFTNMLKGEPLPKLTQFVLGVSEFVQGNLLISIALIGLFVFGFRFLVRTTKGARIWDRVLLKIPVVGDLVLKAAIARFTRTLGTLLSSGVRILEALQITRDTAGNVHIAEAVDQVQARVKAGEGIGRPLESTGVFPGMVSSMIEVGEETGKLPEMLERVADTYEDEVDNAVNALTSILEPVMIVLMAGMVGTIVIALFLPLVKTIQTLS